MNSKDTEKNKVHFSNASNGPEKDDIISLYGTPKEEMLPGVSADGYRAEDEESLSHKGKNTRILLTSSITLHSHGPDCAI